MANRSSPRDLSLWQRYRAPAFTAAAALITVVIVELAFPSVDLSRDSADRYWFFGAVLIIALVVFGIQRLIRNRRGSAQHDDEVA